MPKFLFPAAVWLHGAQSTSTGARVASGHTCSSIVWFAHSMRCVVMTPFGVPVEPDVNRIFATVSGPTCACARSAACASPSSASASPKTSSSGSIARTRAAAAGVGDERRERPQHVDQRAQPRGIRARARVVRRDRRRRHARVHRGEHDGCVIDPVLRDHRERPVRGAARGEQRAARRGARGRTSRAYAIVSHRSPRRSPTNGASGVAAAQRARSSVTRCGYGRSGTPERRMRAVACAGIAVSAAASAAHRRDGSSRRSRTRSRSMRRRTARIRPAVPRRLGNGIDAPSAACASGGSSPSSGVSNRPGAIVTTRMPNCASSRASGSVSATMPPFDAAYAA